MSGLKLRKITCLASLCLILSLGVPHVAMASEGCGDWQEYSFWTGKEETGIMTFLFGRKTESQNDVDDTDLERIRKCIATISEINGKSQNGFSPLHIASEVAQDPRVIDLLVFSGADIHIRSADGTTALQHAAMMNPNPAIIDALVEQGADLAVRTDEGLSLLSVAAQGRSTREVVGHLLALGLDPEDRDQFGLSALHYAARSSGDRGIIEDLIEASSDVNVRSNNGWTPLHHAAFVGQILAIEILLEHGADPNALDYDIGITPMHAATASKHPRVFEVLAKAGGDPNFISRSVGSGSTPLNIMLGQTPRPSPFMVKALLDAGASVTLRDGAGLNAMEAARLVDAPKAILDLLEAARTVQTDHPQVICAEIRDDAKRLACHDRLSSGAAVTSVEPQPNRGEQWMYSDERSNLDGRLDVWLSVDSQNTQPNQIGRSERARLWVRCMENRTNVFVTFNNYTSDNQKVRYRMDNENLKSIWMETMTGGDGIGIWSGGRAIPFVRELFNKRQIVIGYDSYSDNNLEFTFDVSGLRDRIAPLAASCQWRP